MEGSKGQKQEQMKLPKTMKAIRVVEFGKPAEMQDIEVPEPGPQEVLIQVTYSGVCHTDLHMRTGDLPALKPDKLPRTLGHEGVGKIYKTGPCVTRFKVGDRVCCSCLADACLCCDNCCQGWETACTETKIGSAHVDGTFAQFYKAKEAFVCAIPDEVTDEEAAPINCAGVTSYKALKLSALRCGQWVVLVGAAGGLGYYAIQYAKAMGLKIIAVDRGEEKMNFLKQFRDLYILDEDKVDITEKIMGLTKSGAHGALIIAPSNEAFDEAPKFLRHRGKLVIVGQPPGTSEFDMNLLVMKMITMIGSMVGTRSDLCEALDFVADGVVKSEPTIRNFTDVNEILDDIASLKVTGRNVVKIPEPEQHSRMRRTLQGYQEYFSNGQSGLAAQLVGPMLAIVIAILFLYWSGHTSSLLPRRSPHKY